MARQRAGGDPGGNRFGASLRTLKQHKRPAVPVDASIAAVEPAEESAQAASETKKRPAKRKPN